MAEDMELRSMMNIRNKRSKRGLDFEKDTPLDLPEYVMGQ